MSLSQQIVLILSGIWALRQKPSPLPEVLTDLTLSCLVVPVTTLGSQTLPMPIHRIMWVRQKVNTDAEAAIQRIPTIPLRCQEQVYRRQQVLHHVSGVTCVKPF